MNEELESVETQEVANPVAETMEQENVSVKESEEKVEVAEQLTKERDFEKDSAYARIRREKEAAERKAAKLAEAVKLFGFKGEDPIELADETKAHFLSKPVEEVRNERLKAEEVETLKQELELYKQDKVKSMMDSDLKEIQTADPSVKSLNDLGETFFKLIRTGEFTAMEAYHAAKAKEIKETKIPPKEIGKINQSTGSEKEFYTPDEVDKLTSKQLDDPKIFERVRKSMTKW